MSKSPLVNHDSALLLHLIYDKLWGNPITQAQSYYANIPQQALTAYTELSVIQLLNKLMTTNSTKALCANHDATFSSIYGLSRHSTAVPTTSSSSLQQSAPRTVTHSNSDHYRAHLSPTSPNPLNPYSTFEPFSAQSALPTTTTESPIDATSPGTDLNSDILALQDTNNPFSGGTILMAAVLTENLDVVRFILEICPQTIFATHYQSGQSALSYLAARFTDETSLISVEIAQVLVSTYLTILDLSKQSHNIALNPALFAKFQLGPAQPSAQTAGSGGGGHPAPNSTSSPHAGKAGSLVVEPEVNLYSGTQAYSTSYDTCGLGLPSTSALSIGLTPTIAQQQQQQQATTIAQSLAQAVLSAPSNSGFGQTIPLAAPQSAINSPGLQQQHGVIPTPPIAQPGSPSPPPSTSQPNPIVPLPAQLAKLPANSIYPFHTSTVPLQSYNTAVPTIIASSSNSDSALLISNTVHSALSPQLTVETESLLTSPIQWFIANDLFYSLCILLTSPCTTFHTPTFYLLSLLLTNLSATLTSPDFHFLLFLLYLRPTHSTDMASGPFLSCLDLMWSFWKQTVKSTVTSAKTNLPVQSLTMVEHFCSTGFFANNITLHTLSHQFKQVLLNNPTNQLALLSSPHQLQPHSLMISNPATPALPPPTTPSHANAQYNQAAPHAPPPPGGPSSTYKFTTTPTSPASPSLPLPHPPLQLKYPPQLYPTPQLSHFSNIKSDNFSPTVISSAVNAFPFYHTEPFLVPQPAPGSGGAGFGFAGGPNSNLPPGHHQSGYFLNNNQYTPMASYNTMMSQKDLPSQSKGNETSKMSKKDQTKMGKEDPAARSELVAVDEMQSAGTSSSLFHKRGSIPSLDYQINPKHGELSRFNSTTALTSSQSNIPSSWSRASFSEKSISRSITCSVNQSTTSRGSIVSLFNSNSPVTITTTSDTPPLSPSSALSSSQISLSGIHTLVFGSHNVALGINPTHSSPLHFAPSIAPMSLAQQLPITSQLSTATVPFDIYDKSTTGGPNAAAATAPVTSIDYLSSTSVPSTRPREIDLSIAFRSQRAYITLYFLLLSRTPSTTMIKTLLDSISIAHIHQIYDPVQLLFKSSSPKTNATKSILTMLLKKGFTISSVESIILTMFHMSSISTEPNKFWYELQYNYDVISQQQYHLWEHLSNLFLTSAGFSPNQGGPTSASNLSSPSNSNITNNSSANTLTTIHSPGHSNRELSQPPTSSGPRGSITTWGGPPSNSSSGTFGPHTDAGRSSTSGGLMGNNRGSITLTSRDNLPNTSTQTWLSHPHFKIILLHLFQSPNTHFLPIASSNTTGSIGIATTGLGSNSSQQFNLNMTTSLIYDVLQHANLNPSGLSQPQLPITLRPFFYFSVFQHLLYNNNVEITTLRFFLTKLLNNNITFLPILLFHSLPLIITTCSFDRLIHLVSLLHEVYTQQQQTILSSFNFTNSISQGVSNKDGGQTPSAQSQSHQSAYSTYILSNWARNWGFHIKKTNFLFTFITSAQQYATAPLFNTIITVLYPTVTYYDVYDILLCIKQILMYIPSIHPLFNAHTLAHPRQIAPLQSTIQQTLTSPAGRAPTVHQVPSQAHQPTNTISNLMSTMSAATPSASMTPQNPGRQVYFNRSTNNATATQSRPKLPTNQQPSYSPLHHVPVLTSQSTTTTQQTQIGMDPYTDFSVYLRILVVLEHLYTLSPQSHHFLSTFFHNPLPSGTIKQPTLATVLAQQSQVGTGQLPPGVVAGHVSPYLPSSYLLAQPIETSLDLLISSSPTPAPQINIHLGGSLNHNNNNAGASHATTAPPNFFSVVKPHQLTSSAHRSHPQHLSLFQAFVIYGYLDQPFAEQLFQCLFQLTYSTEFNTYLPQTTSKMVPSPQAVAAVSRGRRSTASQHQSSNQQQSQSRSINIHSSSSRRSFSVDPSQATSSGRSEPFVL